MTIIKISILHESNCRSQFSKFPFSVCRKFNLLSITFYLLYYVFEPCMILLPLFLAFFLFKQNRHGRKSCLGVGPVFGRNRPFFESKKVTLVDVQTKARR